MNCSCATTSFGFPWDRLTQRIIDFENARRVSKLFQSAAISRRQFLASDSQKFPDRNIQKNRARFRQVAKILDAMIHFDLPAELTQISGKRVRNLLRSPAWNRPAHRVSRKPKHQRKCLTKLALPVEETSARRSRRRARELVRVETKVS